ncbi:uncharacterized protein LOC8023740 [Ixodes scapularis]|uniref:uncharacterized protein LOC8023740 n=1 Tax=Ixodes scapularis TaxID=6945 RepID=UPI0011619DFC|nr:uncharacterized protein LOC8023740 [Ixodes scapularis]
MLAWRTRYCCFGCTVKEGTLVVGIAIIVLRIINLIFISLGYSQLDEIQEEASYKLTWLPTLFVTGMVDCVVEIVACILLVKAASDDNRYLLIPWLVYNSLCIISHVVGAIHFFFVSVYVGLAGVIGGILVIILSVRIYIFVIVAVYYKLLLQSLPFVLQSDEEVELISHSGSPGLESNGSGASPDFGGSLVEFPGVSI